MSFIKRGGIDGKILNIVDGDDLTEDQKKAVKMSKELVKQSDEETSKQEKLGN